MYSLERITKGYVETILRDVPKDHVFSYLMDTLERNYSDTSKYKIKNTYNYYDDQLIVIDYVNNKHCKTFRVFES